MKPRRHSPPGVGGSYPQQLAFTFESQAGDVQDTDHGSTQLRPSHSSSGWRRKSPSRWTREEAQAYELRAQQAQAGDGDAQRECLAWLDSLLH